VHVRVRVRGILSSGKSSPKLAFYRYRTRNHGLGHDTCGQICVRAR